MKAMSKFFLIFAAILIVAGIIICLIASGMAKKEDVLLFPEKVDGKYVYTLDISETDISKISLDVTDANINVYTDSETEYVEFINFNENYYSLSSTNHVLSFDEYVDFKSMITFWDADYTFKGIRSLFRLGNKIEGEKEINVYISDDRDIKIFDFSLANGNINVSHLSTETDYKFSLDNGEVTMKDISTVSNVTVTANKCTLNIENCSFSGFECDAADITLKGDVGFCHSFTVNSKSGSIDADISLDSDEYEVAVLTSGSLSVNGDTHTGAFKYLPEGEELPEDHTTIKITGEQLGVDLTYKSLSESTVIDGAE